MQKTVPTMRGSPLTTRSLLGSLFLVGVLLVASIVWQPWPEALDLHDSPVHAAIEMLGAVSAVLLSLLLLSQCNQEDTCASHLYPVSLGFLAIGILDGFHAVANDTLPGFVWLRSLAAFFGGLLPALIWFERGQWLQQIALHRMVAAAASVLGVFFLLHPDALPALDATGRFISALDYINVAGGLLSFAAAAYFVIRHKRKANREDAIFAALYLVLGCSSVIFPFSKIGDTWWWLWHILRLLAYGLAMRYMFTNHAELLRDMHAEIFERKRAETALRESEEQFRVLVEHAPEAIVVFDVGLNRFVDANANAEHLFGYDREELLRHSPADFYPPEQPDAMPPDDSVRARSEETLAGRSIVFERLVRNARGEDILCEVRLVKLPAVDRTLIRGSYIDITQRKMAEAKIEFLAFHDALTGLPNRLLAKDHLELAMSFADRTNTKAAVLFLDLDNFKTVNDSLGHPAGDALLKQVATRLHECLRDMDTISRQGGDEFMIVLADMGDPDAITRVAEKMLERLAESFNIDGHELSTSSSIGIAVYPDDGKDFETLLKKADTAMYQAKEGGRDTYRFYSEQMNIDSVEHLHMRNSLKKALEREEFVLHYQPQIDLASGAVVGAEALIRWEHPDQGIVPPGRFISIAEHSGLIVPMGEWVLREACRQGVAWRQAGLPKLIIAVNLSAVQFKRGSLDNTVAQILAETGFDPAFLELELTESILIQSTENVLGTVQRLKSLGVKLSIDDFGTGYSSLAYLKRLAVDKLKIDQSFIRNLADDPDDAAIVRAIIQMAQSLNLRVIAEGVEDERLLSFLRFQHCDEAQGYYFGRPMPSDAFMRYLADTQIALA